MTRCIVAVAAAALWLAPGLDAACAPDPDPDSVDYLAGLSLEELANVDVSAASLLQSTLLDAASSITAVGPGQWQRQGARRLLDALETQAATLVLPHTSGNQVLAIRGFARSTSYTGVATSWDGVPLNDLLRSAPQFNMPAINLGALSQIQLIQGPGSALYGSDAFHGLIALRGFESGRDVRQASGSAGSDGYYEGAYQHSGAIDGATRWHLALAANGQGDQARRARYTSPVDGKPAGDERANRFGARTASLKLASDAAQAWSWYGGLYLHHYDADAFQGLGTRLSGVPDLGWLDTDFTMAQAGVRYRPGAARSFEVKSYYWRVENDLASHLLAAGVPVHRDFKSEQYRAGLQAIYRDAYAPWRTEWALALGDEWLGVDSVKAEMRSPLGLVTAPNPADGARRNVKSATVEMNTHWAEQRWRLVYGGRLDDYADFGRHSSPRLGLIYHPRSDSAVKLLYGQAFRAPSAVEIGGAQNSVLGNPNLKPEVIDSYELIGLRQDARYLAQFTLFRVLWRDGIAAVPAPLSRLTQYQNAGRNDAKGASTSVQIRSGPWLFDAAGAYVTSRNARTDATYDMFPRFMLNLGIGHTLLEPACSLYLSGRWLSRMDDIGAAEGFAPHGLPRYARIDASLTRDMSSRTSVVVQLRNLFNRDNRLPSPPGSLGGIPDERLNLRLAVHHRF